MTHCNPATVAFRSVPIVGSATLTTVASRNAMPDPSTVASRTQSALGVPQVTGSIVFSPRCSVSRSLFRFKLIVRRSYAIKLPRGSKDEYLQHSRPSRGDSISRGRRGVAAVCGLLLGGHRGARRDDPRRP